MDEDLVLRQHSSQSRFHATFVSVANVAASLIAILFPLIIKRLRKYSKIVCKSVVFSYCVRRKVPIRMHPPYIKYIQSSNRFYQ